MEEVKITINPNRPSNVVLDAMWPVLAKSQVARAEKSEAKVEKLEKQLAACIDSHESFESRAYAAEARVQELEARLEYVANNCGNTVCLVYAGAKCQYKEPGDCTKCWREYLTK